ncbi:MAG TPA: pitrilysin family protein, partial [Blastocatellia bacterium]|nr:pitrilysin family protein [Blastocatellia bacterium]
EDHRAPIVTMTIALPAGEVNDPAESPGLAEATASLITEGSAGLTSQALSQKVERLGGRLASSAGSDFAEISISALSQTTEQMLGVLADVLLKPDFPESEIALYKDSRIQNLTAQRQDPGFLVGEQFNKVIYGAHPYSISAPTPNAVSGLSRQSLRAFYEKNYHPEGSVAVIVGDFNWEQVQAKARTFFGSWQAKSTVSPSLPNPPVRSGVQIFLLDRPGSAQANIRIGNLALARSDKDYIPLLVANTILGGGTSSRLFLDVREQKGYTYDVGSYVSPRKQYGAFFGSTETRTEVAGAAIKAILDEFERMRNEKVSDSDLQHAKNFIDGSFSLSLSTQGSLAGQLLEARLLNLGDDSLETFRSRVDSVTVDDVQRAARKYISRDRYAIVVVGDASKLKSQLQPLAPVLLVR